VKAFWLFSFVTIVLAGCASGPKYTDIASGIQPVDEDSGRIYIYRTVVLGAAVQPEVKLNGEVIGTAVPQGFFFVDRPPGDYEIVTSTEVERSLSFTLDAGETRYVRLNIGMGFFVGHVYPELVEPAVGRQEILSCKYTGIQSELAGTR
jgi:hypothetical protein